MWNLHDDFNIVFVFDQRSHELWYPSYPWASLLIRYRSWAPKGRESRRRGGGDWCPLPNRLGSLGERRELPQRGFGQSLGRRSIFGIFEVHRTLMLKRTVPAKPVFRKKIHSIDDWGRGMPPLATPLPQYLSIYLYTTAYWRLSSSQSSWNGPLNVAVYI